MESTEVNVVLIQAAGKACHSTSKGSTSIDYNNINSIFIINVLELNDIDNDVINWTGNMLITRKVNAITLITCP